MKNRNQLFQLSVAVLLLAGAFAFALLPGCSTTQQTASFQAATGTDAAVRAAMIGWGAYVAVEHPGTNSEMQVKNAFVIYRNAELAVIDATEAVSTNATATNFLSAALIAEAAAQADLITIVGTLTNSVTH